MRHRQPMAGHALGARLGLQLRQGQQRPRHHGVGRAVVGRNRQLGSCGQQLLHLGSRGQQGHHATTGRQSLHQPSPSCHQRQGIRQIEHTRQMGGHDLTDAVAEQQVWLEPPALPQPGQGIAHHKQRRLGEAGLIQQLGRLPLVIRIGKQHAGQGLRQQRIQQLRGLLERGAKHGVMGVQALGHPKALGALAGE